MLTVTALQDSKDWKEFLRLPWKIYQDFPQWVPPLVSDQKRELDREKGAFFNDGFGSGAEFFLCRDGKEVVGRIAAIRNERHLARHDDGVGFFGFFECLNREGVARALLDRAESWLKEEGLLVSRGPTSFTLNDPAGVMIKGHHLVPAFLMGYSPPYYADLLENCRYRKARDLLGYHLSMDDLEKNLFPYEAFHPEAQNVKITTRPIERKNLENEAKLIADLFSESWNRNWGAFPILSEELVKGARELGPYFDERLAYLAFVGDEPAGVFLAIPDPSEIIREMDGRRSLKGVLKILTTRKKFERIRLLLFGSLARFRELPIAPALVSEIYKRKADFPSLKTVELFWILENNQPSKQLAEALGALQVQTLRIYERFF